MKTWKKLALCAACFAAISFAMPDYADAARLGRGRSFGSSSIMKNPAPAPSGIKSGASSATTMNRQATGQQNASGGAAAMTQNRGGLFGGLFGGLLAGTLLGSMLGGTGFGGAIGSFMNILLFVALGFFAMRLSAVCAAVRKNAVRTGRNAPTNSASPSVRTSTASASLRVLPGTPCAPNLRPPSRTPLKA